MPLRYSIGIESLGDENLILLTSLKETLKPKRGRILDTLTEIEEKKRKKYRIETLVRVTDRVFTLLELP